MEDFRKTSGEFLEQVETARATQKTTQRQQAQNAGSGLNWLVGSCPRLASGSPPDWTDDEFLAENLDAYRDYEHRLSLCARCPEPGGACAHEHRITKVGHVPTWQDRRVVQAPCGKWDEYKLRRRMELSGIPELFCGSRFGDYGRKGNEAAVTEIMAFAARLGRGERGFMVVSGPTGSGKTRLAVALLRSVLRKSGRSLVWYSDLTTVRGLMKRRYDDEETDPGDVFGHARESHVLVVDNVDLSRYGSEPWVHDRIETLLRERWHRQRTAIVLTHDTPKALFAALPTLSGFSETPTCQLS